MSSNKLYIDLHSWLTANEQYVSKILEASGEGTASVVTGRAIAEKRKWPKVMVAEKKWLDLFKNEGLSIAVGPQYTDGFGEHDLSLFKECSGEAPSTVLEVKRAKQAGSRNKQNQVVQPFCLFINDVLFSCLNKRLNNAIEYGAILYMHEEFYCLKQESDAPWKRLFGEIPSEPLERTLQYNIVPSQAKNNSGRGNRQWPDFSKPEELQKRHISLMLTCGTNGKLVGIFERNQYTLTLRFRSALFKVNKLVACVCIAEGLYLFDSTNKEIEETNTLLRWLP